MQESKRGQFCPFVSSTVWNLSNFSVFSTVLRTPGTIYFISRSSEDALLYFLIKGKCFGKGAHCFCFLRQIYFHFTGHSALNIIFCVLYISAMVTKIQLRVRGEEHSLFFSLEAEENGGAENGGNEGWRHTYILRRKRLESGLCFQYAFYIKK